jgi:hypothetical protein
MAEPGTDTEQLDGRYAGVNLFWNATPSLRLGLSGQYTQVEHLDNIKPRNFRGMAQSVYVF